MSGITEEGFLSSNSAAHRLLDPAFKLFGRTIPVSLDCKDGGGRQQSGRASVDLSSIQHVDENPDSEDESSLPDELGSCSGSNDGCDEEKMAGGDLEDHVVPPPDGSTDAMQAEDTGRPDDEQPGKEDGGASDQAPKRPDKPIHCPRCKSLDTKFCYFNNYNVNQPRHFCKNCQRYWTAGGTLRNVPVGAGRRKNKHACAHAQGNLPDVVMVRSDPPDPAQRVLPPNPVLLQPVQSNGRVKNGLPPSDPRNALPQHVRSFSGLESSPSSAVLSFGQESPICASTTTAPFIPCRPEMVQGFNKREMLQAQGKRNPSVDSNPPATINTQMDRNASDERNRIEQNEFGASLMKPASRQPATESPAAAEFSGHGASANPMKQEAGSASEVPKYADAALAWASNAPFSFMGGPWPYGANLGWVNALPAMALANAAAQGGSVTPAASRVNLAQNSSSLAAETNSAQAGVQPPWAAAAAAAMGPWAGGIPWPLMQNPLWGPPGWGGALAMPWAAPFTAAAAAAAAAAATAAAAAAAAAAGPDLGNNTILGKHPHEQGEAEAEKVLVPKTLRIDDPGDAARSSIWSTLGLSLGSDKLGAGGIFRDCSKPKSDSSDDPHARTRSSNPAGFDRSVSFHENMVPSSTPEK